MQLPKPSEEYKDFKPVSEVWDIIYGPIKSRRVGNSLGVNLLGKEHKVCSFDCPYCELGLTELRMNKIRKEVEFPDQETIINALRTRLHELVSAQVQLDSISIVGNGEATLYPFFTEIVEQIIEVRDEVASQSKIALFTNGTGFDSRKIANAANKLDLVMVKFDAGNDNMLKLINAPLVRMTASKLIQNVKKLDRFIAQSCFVHGAIDNTTKEHIEDWVEVIALTQPDEVHIYTIDRIPAVSGLKKVDDDTLDIIGQRVAKRTNAKVITFA